MGSCELIVSIRMLIEVLCEVILINFRKRFSDRSSGFSSFSSSRGVQIQRIYKPA